MTVHPCEYDDFGETYEYDNQLCISCEGSGRLIEFISKTYEPFKIDDSTKRDLKIDTLLGN